ncbi:hypothetical protein [Aliiglaciecola sp. NS0011-25]|uniref:hypothetical protein n=1 Tax=Aliiglaciecola sp. NS0011-25 TaxID=3127654 RepID=UPI00310541D6
MAINDSIPERRNLIVISLMIITYYMAGGTVGHDVKLPLSNIVLTDKTNATYIFWIIFLWMNFRYFLIFKSATFKESSREPMETNPNWFFPLKAAISSVDIGPIVKLILHVNAILTNQRLTFKKNNSKKKSKYFIKLGKNLTLSIYSRSDKETELYQLKIRLLNLITGLLCIVKSLFSEPYLSSWYTPWLLSLFSMFLGIKNYLSV